MDPKKTALTFGTTKEAALYFDHALPLAPATDAAVDLGLDVHAPLRQEHEDRLIASLQAMIIGTGLLPSATEAFTVELLQIGGDLMASAAALHRIERTGQAPSPGERKQMARAVMRVNTFLQRHGLTNAPVVWSDDAQTDSADEVCVTLARVNLVDVRKTSWDQIHELRRDSDALARLRRLRLFATSNYAGKSRAFIEDDILQRVHDYQEQAKRSGFETFNAALSTLLSSSSAIGAGVGSMLATMFHAPLESVAVAGAVVPIGQALLEVSKRRFALRNALADNPVSYIVEVQNKLQE